MSELRECPFCGGDDIEFEEPIVKSGCFSGWCNSCSTSGPAANDKSHAIDLWNDREPENQDPRAMGWVGDDGLP